MYNKCSRNINNEMTISEEIEAHVVKIVAIYDDILSIPPISGEACN